MSDNWFLLVFVNYILSFGHQFSAQMLPMDDYFYASKSQLYNEHLRSMPNHLLDTHGL